MNYGPQYKILEIDEFHTLMGEMAAIKSENVRLLNMLQDLVGEIFNSGGWCSPKTWQRAHDLIEVTCVKALAETKGSDV